MSAPDTRGVLTYAEVMLPLQRVVEGQDPTEALAAILDHPLGPVRAWSACYAWATAATVLAGLGFGVGELQLLDVDSDQPVSIDVVPPTHRTTIRILHAASIPNPDLAFEHWQAIPTGAEQGEVLLALLAAAVQAARAGAGREEPGR